MRRLILLRQVCPEVGRPSAFVESGGVIVCADCGLPRALHAWQGAERAAGGEGVGDEEPRRGGATQRR